MSTALQILYHDKQVIPYRRELRPLLESVNATILFQEAVYLHGLKNPDPNGVIRPFYMFRVPSLNNKSYQPGQSWVELLGFSPREFDGAIKKIGTKISIRKDDPLEVMARALVEADIRGLLVYWTTAERVTYYLLNVPLAEMVVEFCYNVFQPGLDMSWSDARRQFREFVTAELTRPNQQKRDYVIAVPDGPNQQKRDYLINKSAITYSRFSRLAYNIRKQKDLQKDLQKNKQQQYDHDHDHGDLIAESTGGDAVVVVEDILSGENFSAETDSSDDTLTVRDALQIAGIKGKTAQRIPATWKRATGKDLTPEDILAWHFYRKAENLNLPEGRKLRVGFVVASLESGERADEQFYERAREYLHERALDVAYEHAEALLAVEEEPALDEDTDSRAIRTIHEALETYLPPIADVGIDAFDAMRANLPEIARDMYARGIDAEDIMDLRLYLAYQGRGIPPPDGILDVFTEVTPEFYDWQERKREAWKVWTIVLQQLDLPPGSVVGRLINDVQPVDLNGALILRAPEAFAAWFARLWEVRGPWILSRHTAYPEDLPIQFIPHET
ncbi:MAG TPA: hypothetical protein ENK60_07790 [Anaerolineae bacterium]|nr:hypothetical protein [Anaerolineae bacterium]